MGKRGAAPAGLSRLAGLTWGRLVPPVSPRVLLRLLNPIRETCGARPEGEDAELEKDQIKI